MPLKFLVEGRPTITAMIKSSDTEKILVEIDKILEQGTDAFGFQIETLRPEERCEKNYKRIFDAMKGKPCYVTNYYRGNPVPITDDEAMDELCLAIQCGGMLADIPADTYDRVPGEFSENPEAVEKQMRVVERIHAIGGEVLMSSHVLRYADCDEVMKIARAHRDRGADIAKVVTAAGSEAELLNNLRTTVILKERLGIPSLFLCIGTHCNRHRMVGPTIGSDMFLVVENSREGICPQPSIRQAREILTLSGFFM